MEGLVATHGLNLTLRFIAIPEWSLDLVTHGKTNDTDSWKESNIGTDGDSLATETHGDSMENTNISTYGESR